MLLYYIAHHGNISYLALNCLKYERNKDKMYYNTIKYKFIQRRNQNSTKKTKTKEMMKRTSLKEKSLYSSLFRNNLKF